MELSFYSPLIAADMVPFFVASKKPVRHKPVLDDRLLNFSSFELP